jgi:prepilin-type processing-associated H-X9-DG protein
LKQQALGIIQYVQDYDEVFPGYSPDWNYPMPVTLQPYIKSFNVFFCPDDAAAGTNDNTLSWANPDSAGVNGSLNISYGYNGYETDKGTSNEIPKGVPSAYDWHGIFDWPIVFKRSESEITQPSATIMIADMSATDNNKNLGWPKNSSGAGGNPIWGTNTIGELNACDTTWFVNCDIPSGKLPVSATYDGSGQNGQVSVPHVSRTLANFAFADGHVKAMKPAATNPNGVLDQYNLWDATR